MQVLSVGTKNQVTCQACESVLQFVPSDIRLKHRPLTVGHNEIECMPEPEDHYVGQVECPVCHAFVTVPTTGTQRRELLRGPRDY